MELGPREVELAPDYCTVEQCHAIVNAAIAQLKLDLGAAAGGGLLEPDDCADEAASEMVLSLGSMAASMDGDVIGRRSFDGELSSISASAARPSSSAAGGGLGKTPRVKALIPKQVGRATVGVGEVEGGFAAPPRATSMSDTAGSEPVTPRERLESDIGTAAPATTHRAASSADIGDSVFVRGYSPELLAVGVLKKWTNYGKGWESRIVVLDAGIIRYFSTKGKNKVNVAAIMAGRECYRIGDKVAKLQRKQEGMGQGEFQDKPLGEMHISVATIRISKSGMPARHIRSVTAIRDHYQLLSCS
jgi:hypothetical protein